MNNIENRQCLTKNTFIYFYLCANCRYFFKRTSSVRKCFTRREKICEFHCNEVNIKRWKFRFDKLRIATKKRRIHFSLFFLNNLCSIGIEKIFTFTIVFFPSFFLALLLDVCTQYFIIFRSLLFAFKHFLY